MTSSLRAWLRLDPRDKLETCSIVLLAMAAEVAVRMATLPHLARILGIHLVEAGSARGRDQKRIPRAGLEAEAVERRALAVDRVYRRWPRRNSCLRRALVLGYLIRKAGPTLLIGVAKEDGEIHAHAWIEIDGKVIGDSSGEFAPLRFHKTAG